MIYPTWPLNAVIRRVNSETGWVNSVALGGERSRVTSSCILQERSGHFLNVPCAGRGTEKSEI